MKPSVVLMHLHFTLVLGKALHRSLTMVEKTLKLQKQFELQIIIFMKYVFYFLPSRLPCWFQSIPVIYCRPSLTSRTCLLFNMWERFLKMNEQFRITNVRFHMWFTYFDIGLAFFPHVETQNGPWHHITFAFQRVDSTFVHIFYLQFSPVS